jgi:hypothetical protein
MTYGEKLIRTAKQSWNPIDFVAGHVLHFLGI